MDLPHRLVILKETGCNICFSQIALPDTVLALNVHFASSWPVLQPCQHQNPSMATNTQLSPLQIGHHQNQVCGRFQHTSSLRENYKGVKSELMMSV